MCGRRNVINILSTTTVDTIRSGAYNEHEDARTQVVLYRKPTGGPAVVPEIGLSSTTENNMDLYLRSQLDD